MTEDLGRVAFPIEWRTLSTDDRIVGGVAVPWNEVSYLTPSPQGERFLSGSLTRSVKARGDRLKLFTSHDHSVAVGRPVSLDARHPDGLWTRWRMANTPAGDAALAEVAEGMLDAFSVGFRTVRARRGEDGAREILEADLYEVSIAPIGAYDGARVLEVREPHSAHTATQSLQAWLDEHPIPAVDLTPLPDLRASWHR